MRFPRYSVGLFVVALLVNVIVAYQSEHHCVGSYGNYRCTGWADAFGGFILLWQMFLFMVLPLIGIVALIRLGQWLVMCFRTQQV